MEINSHEIMDKAIEVVINNRPEWEMLGKSIKRGRFAYFYDGKNLHIVKIQWKLGDDFPEERNTRAEFEHAMLDGLFFLPQDVSLVNAGSVHYHNVSCAVNEDIRMMGLRMHWDVSTTDLM